MRRTAWAVVACAAAVGAGCQWWPHPDRVGPARGTLPVAAVEGLYVETVLVERPLGDPVLDRDLWDAARPPVPAETDVLLSENGFRVRVLGGTLPPAFRQLLAADLINPTGLTFANRPDTVVPTATPPDPCVYKVRPELAGGPAEVKLTGARGGILLRPEWVGNGRVKVWCEPRVQHGEREDAFRPTEDGTGLTVEAKRPTENYPTLGFAVTLGPDDYLVIGTTATAGGTLGGVIFHEEVGGAPRQRVLLVRAGWRGQPPAEPAARARSVAAEVTGRRADR